jgi:predicted RecA/RadA family phage recombinase
MNNYISSGEKVVFTAPAGGVVGGQGVQIGQLFVVAEGSAAAGEKFVGMPRGIHELTKTSAQAWTEGARVFWDISTGEVTTVASTNLAIGVAAAAAANPSAKGHVLLDGIARANEPA